MRCNLSSPWNEYLIFIAFSKEPDNVTKAAKARGTHLRVHYKHCREIGNAIKGRSLPKATAYLQDVLLFKEAIPVTKYTGGIGRHSIGKKYKAPGDKVSWPQKATRTFLDLLRNAQANAEVWFLIIFMCIALSSISLQWQTKGLELEKVIVSHVNCNQAPKMRRRTYRAHGRINGKCYWTVVFFCQLLILICTAYNSSPAHIEIIVEEKSEEVAKEAEPKVLKLSKKQIAKKGLKVPVGEA